jgi:hypothetical protein
MHAHVQKLVSVVKMAIALEDCTTKEQCPVVRFLWAKGLNAKDIYEEMFPVYGGKCLSHKMVHNSVEKFSHGHSKVTNDEMKVRKWLRQPMQLLCCEIRRTGKLMGQVYQCCWRIC